MRVTRISRLEHGIRVTVFGALLLYVWLLAHSALTAWYGLRHSTARADVAIVLGGFVRKDGSPAYNLQRRLAKAVELYASGRVRYLFVSGGDLEGHRNEGRTMHAVLREAGVPDSAIIVDTTATSTFETARVARQVMEERRFGSAVIVTSYYHILRTRLALSRFGITSVRAAHATISHEKRHPALFFRPKVWWHEFAGFYWYLVRPLWWEG